MRPKIPSWKPSSLTAAAVSVGLSVFSLATIMLVGRSAQTNAERTEAQLAIAALPDSSVQPVPIPTTPLWPGEPYAPEELARVDRQNPRALDGRTYVELELQVVTGRDEDAGASEPAMLPVVRPDAGFGLDAGRSLASAGNGDVERQPCGMTLCPRGMVCCNERCNLCSTPGRRCSQLSCNMPMYPVSVACGANTCSANEVCCNLSCGICAPPGEPCSQRLCD